MAYYLAASERDRAGAVSSNAPDLRKNGQLYPTWVMATFEKYLLPAVIRGEHEDPCNVKIKLGLRLYQEFFGDLVRKVIGGSFVFIHGMGSGKTATAINVMNVILMTDSNTTIIILIKASLRNDPWMDDLETWLRKEDSEEHLIGVQSRAAFKRIHFVHYDSNQAKKNFMEIIKLTDPLAPMMFVIDEAHQFISNVHSNLTGDGDRASSIYQHIIGLKKEDSRTRVILLSATPVITRPFELALQFNMLRPGIFPENESEFDRLFVTRAAYPVLDPLKKNLFQRRILGLASYYIGATPDLYARKQSALVKLPMSEYQYQVYRHFEKIEQEKESNARKYDQSSSLYRVYTRHASNFVFPILGTKMNGKTRPMKGDYAAQIPDSEKKGAQGKISNPEGNKKYQEAMSRYLIGTMKYFQRIAEEDKPGATIQEDLLHFREYFRISSDQKKAFPKWWHGDRSKSKLLQEMYQHSPKITAVVCNTFASPGKVQTYSRFVTGEGIPILTLYHQLAGYLPYDHPQVTPGMGYMEYTGGINREERDKIKKVFNSPANMRGQICMIFFFSAAGAEGIQLLGIRMSNILEDDWDEEFLNQVEGRGIRQCSHKDLPMAERTVIAFRYRITKPKQLDADDRQRLSADEHLNQLAKAKSALTGSFLQAVKEAALDCMLFRPHNQLEASYSCFQFPEQMVLGSNPGSAYQEDINEDMNYDLGSNAANSITEKVRVYQISGVTAPGQPSKLYWHLPSTRVVYDHKLHYPIGMVKQTASGDPERNEAGDYLIELGEGIRNTIAAFAHRS